MADGDAKLQEISRNDADCAYADKENEPVLPSDGEKKREEREESKGDGDYIKLSIGDQYMVRRSEDTWREYPPAHHHHYCCCCCPPTLTSHDHTVTQGLYGGKAAKGSMFARLCQVRFAGKAAE